MGHIKQGILLMYLPQVTFFLLVIIEWNKLDPSLRNLASYNIFKNSILKFIRPPLTKFPNAITQKESN